MKSLALFSWFLCLILESPLAGSEPWRFFVFGDSRSYPDRLRQNIQSMKTVDSGAVLCINVGDLTATGQLSEWDAHHQALADGAPDPSVPEDPTGIVRQSLFRTDVSDFGNYIRYFGAIGNHDVGDAGWYANWNAYLPGQKDLGINGTDGIYFSFKYENTFFIVLDSQHVNSDQTTWFRQTLESSDAQSAVWKLVLFHHQVYPCSNKSVNSAQLEWVELMEQHGVQIAFVAHSHTYERTCPMLGGKCAEGGVIYLDTSGAAADTRSVDTAKTGTVSYGDRTDSYSCSEILEAWSESHHFCHFTVDQNLLNMSCYLMNQPDSPFDTLQLTAGVIVDGGQESEVAGELDGGDSFPIEESMQELTPDAALETADDARFDSLPETNEEEGKSNEIISGACGCGASSAVDGCWVLLLVVGFSSSRFLRKKFL